MELNGRKKEIYDLLYESGSGRISVSKLAQVLYVSEMTIRRDLGELEQAGLIKRYRGGALLVTVPKELPVEKRFFVDESEKKELSKLAARFLTDNITIYIDSSSTCQYIIPHIRRFKKITMVTNSVNALLMASKMSIPCILIGGTYHAHDMCFTGSLAESFAKQLNVDVAFFSVLGIADDGILSDPDIEQTMIRKVLFANAKKKIFLLEQSKTNQKYLYTVCHKSEADAVLLLSDFAASAD